jgi:hypothetical protein
MIKDKIVLRVTETPKVVEYTLQQIQDMITQFDFELQRISKDYQNITAQREEYVNMLKNVK